MKKNGAIILLLITCLSNTALSMKKQPPLKPPKEPYLVHLKKIIAETRDTTIGDQLYYIQEKEKRGIPKRAIDEARYKIYKQLYAKAIKNAKIAHPFEISTELEPIVPWNNKIKRLKINGQKHILMVTWIPESYKPMYSKHFLKKQLEKSTPLEIKWEAWVSPIPELKQFVKKYKQKKTYNIPLHDRVTQYLGLPPESPTDKEKKYFVELWVKPEDIFRPCFDSEIIDKECVLDPAGTSYEKDKSFQSALHETTRGPKHKIWDPKSGNWSPPIEHKKFMEKLRENSYKKNKTQYPFTRLGYSFDWGIDSNPKHTGVSEYHIKQGAGVFIHSIIETDKYGDEKR